MTDSERCDAVRGSMTCQGSKGHPGVHWANTGGHRGVRWGLADYGCLVGVEVGLVCMEKGDHTTHRGHPADRPGSRMSWSDPEPIEVEGRIGAEDE